MKPGWGALLDRGAGKKRSLLKLGGVTKTGSGRSRRGGERVKQKRRGRSTACFYSYGGKRTLSAEVLRFSGKDSNVEETPTRASRSGSEAERAAAAAVTRSASPNVLKGKVEEEKVKENAVLAANEEAEDEKALHTKRTRQEAKSCAVDNDTDSVERTNEGVAPEPGGKLADDEEVEKSAIKAEQTTKGRDADGGPRDAEEAAAKAEQEVAKVAEPVTTPSPTTKIALQQDNVEVNGNSNGHSNGHSNGQSNGNGAPADGSLSKDEKRVLEIGTRLPCLCSWKESEYLEAEVVERKKGADGWEYYVHYVNCNRRLDEWVGWNRFDYRELNVPTPAPSGAGGTTGGDAKNHAEISKKSLRKAPKKGLKRKHGELSLGKGTDPKKDERTNDEKEHEEATKVKNIQKIQMGKWEMDTWYYSPFPPEYAECSKLYICEFCLKFLRSYESLKRHMTRCPLAHPPGVEVYRKDNICVFEVDGARNRIYCQNICYIAKLFLDHKTLYYDVNPFWFYVMCEVDSVGAHLVGYFSKEKHSEEDYNVACILTLPSHQRKGYGKFLIDFSYQLSKIEQKPGSPEKPLSDLGLLSYRSYWSQILVDLLRSEKSASALSVQEISDRTMMKTEDIIATLQVLDIIQYYEGQHIIDLRRVNNLKLGSRGLPCDAKAIRWTPKTMDLGRRR